MVASADNINDILNNVPHLRRGTGGVAAVVQNGKVLGKKAWGYADLDQRIPMTAKTVFPICSISKQMVCLAMQSLLQKPTAAMTECKESLEEQMQAELHKLLPHLKDAEGGADLKVADLYNMQSGIRDYWAMTTLWGAKPDDKFSISHDAPQALDRTKSFHFAPGTEYSYSNVNFHILGRIMEEVTGMSLAQILVERLFIPAGMASASLCPNTNGLPLPIVGYEGNATVGYFAATNRIEWAGDAGIAASLEDMIAYEQYLDRSLSDAGSPYATASKQQHFRDGTPSSYGYGLARSERAGKTAISHGGALRGFRHERLQIPSERLSVVVMLNHEAPPSVLTDHILEKVLSYEEPKPKSITAAPGLKGNFLDSKTQLYLEIKSGDEVKPGTITMNYGPGTTGATIKLTSETTAASAGTKASTKLRLDGDTLHVERTDDNRIIQANRIQPPADAAATLAASTNVIGSYRCGEADSTFTVSGEDGVLHGSFDGFIGRGPVWLMTHLGESVWALGNPRSLDSTPPGDWTVVFKRAENGEAVKGCRVGCWLARKLEYRKL